MLPITDAPMQEAADTAAYLIPAIGGVMAVIGGVVAWVVRLMINRMLASLDERFKRIDEVEDQLKRLMTELPIHYQRRDDSIREYTAINLKLDRLYELILKRGAPSD